MSADKNPLEMLFHWAQVKPDKGFLFQPFDGVWKTYTWAETADQVRRMASALASMGFEPGARIAISGRNTAHWFMADLACSMAGFVPVGLYPKQAAAATKYILEHSETRLLFLGPMPDADEFMGAVPKGIKTISFPYSGTPAADLKWDDLVKKHAPMQEYHAPPADTLMTLIYTSGTTGSPRA